MSLNSLVYKLDSEDCQTKNKERMDKLMTLS